MKRLKVINVWAISVLAMSASHVLPNVPDWMRIASGVILVTWAIVDLFDKRN